VTALLQRFLDNHVTKFSKQTIKSCQILNIEHWNIQTEIKCVWFQHN